MLASSRRRALVEAYAIALEHNALLGVSPMLKRSSVPTRILWGMNDSIFSSENADYLDRTFGNSKGVRRLQRAKLFWPEERPDVIVDEAIKLWRNSAV